jgi:hypothetical protein
MHRSVAAEHPACLLQVNLMKCSGSMMTNRQTRLRDSPLSLCLFFDEMLMSGRFCCISHWPLNPNCATSNSLYYETLSFMRCVALAGCTATKAVYRYKLIVNLSTERSMWQSRHIRVQRPTCNTTKQTDLRLFHSSIQEMRRQGMSLPSLFTQCLYPRRSV